MKIDNNFKKNNGTKFIFAKFIMQMNDWKQYAYY